MENIGSRPDPHEASAGLDAVTEAQRAVRDRPWPVWLYPTNALLLAGLALTGLVDSSMIAAFVALFLAVSLVALNNWAGHRIGTPFAIPSSRGFRILVALSAAFVVVSLIAGEADKGWAVVGCAAAAAFTYGLGSIVHYRSTHP